jgi:alpha-galactosidase
MAVRILGDLGSWKATLHVKKIKSGLEEVALKLASSKPAKPPKLKLCFDWPSVDTHVIWHPAAYLNKELSVDWSPSTVNASAVQWAPVACLHSLDGQNRLCFAFSDALNPLLLKSGVVEETAEVACSLELFASPHPEIKNYEASLRLDSRSVSYQQALNEVGAWWAGLPGFKPSPVPEHARLPMYSTWTSFHQNLAPETVEKQCRLAKALGCDTVIVDDGWQTSDNARGYTYCGDWEVSPKRFPDFKAHVRRVHAMGLKYMLWFSVPFVGTGSKAYARFKDKFLRYEESMEGRDCKGILDPRFPEVREYLISTYERALKDWDLDGFKLDFVDCFFSGPEKISLGQGRDYASVPEAADRLLSDVMARLRKMKPDIMIEFRQAYIGPLMRKYGNMFRAADCPNNLLQNHVRVLDIRQLCGNTAVHSDMLLWHTQDSPESAALQLLAVLFSVPQISVLLDKIPKSHAEMLAFWLGYWRENRDVLLDGKLEAPHPEQQYPVVMASTKHKKILALSSRALADFGKRLPKELHLVNATTGSSVVLELGEDFGPAKLEIFDCRGRRVKSQSVRYKKGLHALDVPPSGLATLRL